MGQWISDMTTKKQRRLVTGCTENLQQLQDVVTQEFIFKNKFDTDQTDLIQKLDGKIFFLQQPQ